jgi:hypothetical protein
MRASFALFSDEHKEHLRFFVFAFVFTFTKSEPANHTNHDGANARIFSPSLMIFDFILEF